MKAARDLSHEALIEIVQALQSWLYLGETDGENIVEVWDPDNDWNGADVCEAMATKLSDHGLVPQFLGDKPK